MTQWPPGVKLTFVSGDLKPYKVVEVPRANAGTIVEVSAIIDVPTEPKQYTGYYRLCTAEGQRFGGRFWIDLVVVAPEGVDNKDHKSTESSQPAAPTEAVKPESAEPVTQPPVKSVEQEPVAPPKSVEQKTEPVLESVEVAKSESVEVAKPVEQKSVEPPKSADPKSVEPAKPEPPKLPGGKYAAQVEILKGMGFQDVDLNRYLLVNNNGNVQRVVEWILSHK